VFWFGCELELGFVIEFDLVIASVCLAFGFGFHVWDLTWTWIWVWDFGDDVFLLCGFDMCFANKMWVKFSLRIRN